MKTCCVTGRREIPANRIEYVKHELDREVLQAVEDGYTHFISGFAEGTDLLFASIVADHKEENQALTLEAALPYRSRIKTKNELFQQLIPKCNMVGIHSESYNKGCFMKRNIFMVSRSQRVIAVYDRREEGGTYATICYAQKLKRDIRLIMI